MKTISVLIRSIPVLLLSLFTSISLASESDAICLGGGHPWLSRNRVIELSDDDVDEKQISESFGEDADEVNSVRRQRGKRSVSPENIHAVSGGRYFDITIAMYKNRNDEERAQIGNIITNFARGVYEMTEGRHFIGKVHIIENPGNLKADIHWHATGQNRAQTSFTSLGKTTQIDMFDSLGSSSYFSNEKAGGGTLTHEWGHYEYGFMDEYPEDKIGYFSPNADDKRVDSSLMAGWVWDSIPFKVQCNLSYAYDKNADDQKWRSTGCTAQHRVFGQSCLEQLVNPVEPQIPWFGKLYEGWRYLLTGGLPHFPSFKMHKWPEFSGIDPTSPPKIDLDNNGEAKAVQHLKILWADAQKQMVAFCIDRSGSMSSVDLANAKASTKNEIAKLQEGAMVEVLAFDSYNSISRIVPFTKVTAANKAGIMANVDTITSGNWTALWDAAGMALADMQAHDPSGNYVKSLRLMTDGVNNDSKNETRESIERKCREMGVAFDSISYGQKADSELAAVSAATGGKNFASSDSLASLSSAFSRAGTHGTDRGAVVDSEGKVSNLGTWTETFTMDSTATNLQATVTLSVPAANASIVLEAPSGVRYPAEATVDVGTESSWVFRRGGLESGTWKVIVTAAPRTSVSCFVDSSAMAEPPQFRVWTDEDNMAVYASVGHKAPVDGARVRALVNDNGTIREVPFTGVGGGTYVLALSDCGTFQNGFTVRADAEQGVASYTYVSVMGSGTYDEGAPISESFTRSEWVALGKEDAVSFHASGKGMLEFQWRTDGEGVPERIDFLCNGNTNATLASRQGWTKKEFVFNEDGAHVFHWQTTNEVRKFTGTWLRDVIWHPEPDVVMGPIEVTPRWPWNGLVDIDFSFVPTLAGTKASFAVSGVDGDLGTMVEAKTLSGSYRNLDKGTYRVTWNLGADAPGFHSSAFTVHLDSSIDPFSPPNVEVAGLSASEGINLRWPGMSSAETYIVFRATNANGTDATPIGSVSIRAADGEWVRFLDSTAPNGKTVWYAVKASAWKLDGQRSSFVSARRPMRPPSNLTATEGTRTDGVLVTWTPSANTAKSLIYRCIPNYVEIDWNIYQSVWNLANTLIGETTSSSWMDSTALPGEDYFYAVSCVSTEGAASALPSGTMSIPVDSSVVYGPCDAGWRNVDAPAVTNATRTNTYVYIPSPKTRSASRLLWPGWNTTSVFEVAWRPVDGASSFTIQHWSLDSTEDVETASTTDCFITCTVSGYSLDKLTYPPGRVFRIIPIVGNHEGNASEVKIQ